MPHGDEDERERRSSDDRSSGERSSDDRSSSSTKEFSLREMLDRILAGQHSIQQSQRALHHTVSTVLSNLLTTMASLQDILTDVEQEKTLLDSFFTYLAGLKDQLKAALATSPFQQEKIDQVFAELEQNKAAITAALQANTPAATDPGPTPDPAATPDPAVPAPSPDPAAPAPTPDTGVTGSSADDGA